MEDIYEREHPLIPVLFTPWTRRPDMMEQSYKDRIPNFQLMAAEEGLHPLLLAQVIMKARRRAQREKGT